MKFPYIEHSGLRGVLRPNSSELGALPTLCNPLDKGTAHQNRRETNVPVAPNCPTLNPAYVSASSNAALGRYVLPAALG